MTQVGIDEAKAELLELVERAASGEDIVIERNGRPVARLVPIVTASALADVHGTMRGQIHLAEDFNPLPDDVTDAFGAR